MVRYSVVMVLDVYKRQEEEIAVVVMAQNHRIGHPGLPMDMKQGKLPLGPAQIIIGVEHKPLLRPRNRRSMAEIAQGMIHKVRDQRALHLLSLIHIFRFPSRISCFSSRKKMVATSARVMEPPGFT